MRLSVVFCIVTFVISLSNVAECYTPYAGMKLSLNNTFLSQTVHTMLYKAFDNINQIFHDKNNSKITFDKRGLIQ